MGSIQRPLTRLQIMAQRTDGSANSPLPSRPRTRNSLPSERLYYATTHLAPPKALRTVKR
jgi:hypothetical protein